ncbi:MAG TPA: type VI secretion system protein TssA [Rhodocyclaceae bacterium]|nr:type VI secretion system protein TssA [Rhodocyclaceae bacterium]
MSTLNLEELLAPIPGAKPAGEDVSFDPIIDQIKEARRADADYLNQGDWKSEIKIAEWSKVKELATQVLTTQSKDLQVACWLAEALTQLHGFVGARDGFIVIDGLLQNFWEQLYPEKDGDDLDDRVGRLTWLDNNLSAVLRLVPMTAPVGEAKGYGWIRWQESRDVDNLARQSKEHFDQALKDGKIGSEMWTSAVVQTPAPFYETLLASSGEAHAALKALVKTIDSVFGYDAPSTGQLGETLTNICKLAIKLAEEKGIATGAATEAAADGETTDDVGITSGAAPQGQGGPPRNREDAVKRLREVAEYFRAAEPHSPVTYIVEKAVRWSGMRLDTWLREVVRDDTTKDRLKDMLGYTDE